MAEAYGELTVENVARAWASIDGKREQFDAGKAGDDEAGHYQGYMVEAEELLKRALSYGRQ